MMPQLTEQQSVGTDIRHDEMVGRRFTRLTVLRRADPPLRSWVCVCDCGNTVTVTGSKLRFQNNRSCGCLHSEAAAKNCPPHDISGQRFGKLVAISIAGRTKRGSRWLCRCDCGNEARCLITNLRRGVSKSCGCLSMGGAISARFKAATASRTLGMALPAGEGALRSIFGNYRRAAAERGIEWALTLEQFRTMTRSHCSYCGCPPASIGRASRRGRGDCLYNGVDRVNNDLGYSADNTTPCCKQCNTAKMTMSLDDFMGWVSRVYHHSLGGGLGARAS